MLIPKIIHFVWIPGFSQAPEYAYKNIDKWRELNPEFEIMVWEEKDVRKVLPEKSLKCFDHLDMSIKKADLARLEILYKFGGIYLDCDLDPSLPLSEFFKKTELEKPVVKRANAQRITQMIPFNGTNKNLIFSREWKPIVRFKANIFTPRNRIANGTIFSIEENPIIKDFVEKHRGRMDRKVLYYLGPHVMTKYFISIARQLQPNDLIVIPPHHFLWEESVGPMANWSVSAHMGKNTWGDHAKPDYWNV